MHRRVAIHDGRPQRKLPQRRFLVSATVHHQHEVVVVDRRDPWREHLSHGSEHDMQEARASHRAFIARPLRFGGGHRRPQATPDLPGRYVLVRLVVARPCSGRRGRGFKSRRPDSYKRPCPRGLFLVFRLVAVVAPRLPRGHGGGADSAAHQDGWAAVAQRDERLAPVATVDIGSRRLRPTGDGSALAPAPRSGSLLPDTDVVPAGPGVRRACAVPVT
jgi:hypothetical protein